MKVTHETKLTDIRRGLMDVLEEAGPGGVVEGNETAHLLPKEAAE